MSKPSWFLRWMFPIFNVEISACISIVALYMFFSEGGHTGLWNHINESYTNNDYLDIIFIAALIITGVVFLLMPWISIAKGKQLGKRGLKTSILMAALVLICSTGWMASLYQVKYHQLEGDIIIHHYLVLSIVAFLEFIILSYGVFHIFDKDSEHLAGLVKTEKLDLPLFGFNLGVTGIFLSLEHFTKVIENPDASLLLINIYFISSKLRNKFNSTS